MYRKKRDNSDQGYLEPIAVIGMACKLPEAEDYLAFWQRLIQGKSSIRRVPASRWNWEGAGELDPKVLPPWCGWMDGIEMFDPQFFGISPREARSMDPQQRLLLQETWHCVEDAGLNPTALKERSTGVYVGVMANDYHQSAVATGVEIDSFSGLGNYDCILANRISYCLGLNGPSFSVGAACASSNVALHLARQSLLTGETDFAIAAGVSLNFHPWKNISFARAHMLSPDGKCKTFDQSANGYVPGEGVVVLLLQPLDQAIADGHAIHGVISGSAINHNGSNASITAPSVSSQAALIHKALEEARLEPQAISYLEAHGTGTSLGDPIEIAALQQVFQGDSGLRRYVGSVKTNIGHLEAAAGLAGVLKTLLMIKHRFIPPTLNLSEPNGLIDFDSSNFVAPVRGASWQAKDKLRAGVSSFGFGGANSHVIVEEFLAEKTTSAPLKPKPERVPFALSAKSATSLRALVKSWIDFLDKGEAHVRDLADIGATLLAGRSSGPFRMAGWVSGMSDVRRLLSAPIPERPTKPQDISVVIGELDWNGQDSLRSFFDQWPGFQDVIHDKLTTLCAENDSDFIQNWENAEWPDDRRGLYQLATVWAFIEGLRDSGVAVQRIGGVAGGGDNMARVIAGMLKTIPEWTQDWREALANSEWQRPEIPYWNLESGAVLHPLEVTVEYLEKLLTVELNPDPIRALLLRCSSLLVHQRTFTKYFGEWRHIAGELGLKVCDQLEELDAATDLERKVTALAFYNSLNRVREKWNLPDIASSIPEELKELEAWISSGALSIEECVSALHGNADRSQLAEILTLRWMRLRLGDAFALLKQFQPSPVLENSSLSALHPEELESSTALIIGKVPSSSSWIHPDRSLTLDPQNQFSALELLLELWSRGWEVDWRQVFQDGSYSKQRLPGYPFDKAPYWLKRTKESGASVIQENKWEFQASDRLIADHVIGGVKLVPGAAFVDLGWAACGAEGGGDVLCMENFRALKPCAVYEQVKVLEAEVKDRGFELRFGETLLASGRRRKHTELPRSGWTPVADPKIKQSQEAVYSLLNSLGYHYGPSLQVVDWVEQKGSGNCVVKLGAQEERWEDGLCMSRRLLDGVFQSALLILLGSNVNRRDGYLWAPCAFSSLVTRRGIQGTVWIRSSHLEVLPNGDSVLSLTAVDVSGQVAIELKELILKLVPANFGASSKSSAPARDLPLHHHHHHNQSAVLKSTVQPVEHDATANTIITPKTTASKSSDAPGMNRILDALKTALSAVMESEVQDTQTPLSELGVDSILGVDFVSSINEIFHINLSATDLFDYPTLAKLGAHIFKEFPNAQDSLRGVFSSQTSSASHLGTTVASEQNPTNSGIVKKPVSQNERHDSEVSDSNNDIAIVGMSARYGGAETLDQFWENIREGKPCIEETPADHWGPEWYSQNPADPNRTICKWGGFLEDSDRFDALFFRISPADAEWMDPQQRVILQECWKAFENAGYTPSSLSESRCGVFIGVMNNDYQEELSSSPNRSLQAAELVGNSNAILSARISYFLNLRGPSMAIDTACSSSLVAMHYAANALRNQEADLMLVGGVTLYRSPRYYVRMSQAGMLSPTGRCWTFDERADGYVPGEGCGVVILKRLKDAIRDRDQIHAVIKGSALNQDGHTNGITAPSSASQKALLTELYRNADIHPETLGYVEAHGTGTPLGDPIEFNALTKAFGEFTDAKQFCAIGSVKANIGHTLDTHWRRLGWLG